jgi:hypothetical protein
MSSLYINLNIKKVGQFLETIEYTTRIGDYEKSLLYIKKLKEYLDYRVAQTAFEKGDIQ